MLKNLLNDTLTPKVTYLRIQDKLRMTWHLGVTQTESFRGPEVMDTFTLLTPQGQLSEDLVDEKVNEYSVI